MNYYCPKLDIVIIAYVKTKAWRQHDQFRPPIYISDRQAAFKPTPRVYIRILQQQDATLHFL